MESVTNKQIYLKSPTISRYQPQATPPIATPSPPGNRRVGHQSVRGGVATPPHIALAVETGLIMKGGDTALVIHCKGMPLFGDTCTCICNTIMDTVSLLYKKVSLLYGGVLYVEVILYSKECNWYTRCCPLNGGVRYRECPLRETTL